MRRSARRGRWLFSRPGDIVSLPVVFSMCNKGEGSCPAGLETVSLSRLVRPVAPRACASPLSRQPHGGRHLVVGITSESGPMRG